MQDVVTAPEGLNSEQQSAGIRILKPTTFPCLIRPRHESGKVSIGISSQHSGQLGKNIEQEFVGVNAALQVSTMLYAIALDSAPRTEFEKIQLFLPRTKGRIAFSAINPYMKIYCIILIFRRSSGFATCRITHSMI